MESPAEGNALKKHIWFTMNKSLNLRQNQLDMDKLGRTEIIIILSIVLVKFVTIIVMAIVMHRKKARNKQLFLESEAQRKAALETQNTTL